jgi:hypothetical protein
MKKHPNEIWKDIAGFEGYYQVSNMGRVKRLWKRGKERFKSPFLNKDGYYQSMLSKDKIRVNVLIHRLVSSAFIPNPNNLATVNHIDKNKINNIYSNLEWMSSEENVRYSKKKAVLQCNLGGNVIKEWEAFSDVERSLGYDTGFLIKCCMGKVNTAYGYKWKYKIRS